MSTNANQLYADHIRQIKQRTQAALQANQFDRIIIASGVEKFTFLDDRPYPFCVNPHFKLWLPLVHHPHCWIAYTPGMRPKLIYFLPDDYWHLPPEAPSGEWTEHFEIATITSAEQACALLQGPGRTAIIGESDAALPGIEPNNPAGVVEHLHYHRAYKTPYEIAMMRLASQRAVRGHVAAREAFVEGCSELAIHRRYLSATGHSDINLPYGNIVALNAHGATLHYQYQQAEPPPQSRSLLIDAGASHAGYAADITRTWAADKGDFADLIDAVDAAQRRLVAGVQAGVDYRDLHLQAHLQLARILQSEGIVALSAEGQVATGISRTFFPHGLGHLLGLQVHDVAGFAANENGGTLDKPEGHPYLRLTRTLQPGMVVTIEPGIYFIDTLLAKLKMGEHAKVVNWERIELLRPYGGIRIEDDVVCTDGAPENLTRDAFAGVG